MITEQLVNAAKGGRITCPYCSSDRKKSTTKDMTVSNREDGAVVYHCHHCSASGSIQPTKKLTLVKEKNVPVAIGGAVGTHRACRPAQGAVVLRAAVYPVERGVSLFTCDIVKLGDRQIGGVLPIGASSGSKFWR